MTLPEIRDPVRYDQGSLDELLKTLVQAGASDILLISESPVRAYLRGRWETVGMRALKTYELADLLNAIDQTNSSSRVASGESRNFAYEVSLGSRTSRSRFRINASGVRRSGDRDIKIVLRTIPDTPPPLDSMGLPPELLEALFPLDGLVGVAGATGCHARGTEILMSDGSLKKVEDILVGDKVMGPDSKPRTVTGLHRGRGRMVCIVPVKGDPFVVNDGHILALIRTNRYGSWKKNKWIKDKQEYLSVKEYEKTTKWFKHLHKLYRVPVEFGEKVLPIPPYLLGVFLGDGSTGIKEETPRIANPDPEILEAFQSEFLGMTGTDLHLSVGRLGQSTQYYRIIGPGKGKTNPFQNELRQLNLSGCRSGEKFIPFRYKTGSRRQRLELLAGLLDTDGHMDMGGFDYISKSERLANDFAFLGRSLGFAAYVRKCVKSCQTGSGRFTGIYYRVSLSGDCSEIPIRVPRKKASVRCQKKSVLRTGFAIEDVGEGEYYGFEVDVDHLYLTADFTVHHNSGKSTLLAGVLREKLERGGCHIATAEAPIEFVYDKVETRNTGVIAQGEVPTHHPSFGKAVEEMLRQKPDVILVGESRDKETIENTILACQTGHAAYTTVHTNGVGETIGRMAEAFPGSERDAAASKLLAATRVLIHQRLLRKADGSGRVPIREWLVFDDDVKGALFSEPFSRWPFLIGDILREKGQSAAQDAERAFGAGLISRSDFLAVGGKSNAREVFGQKGAQTQRALPAENDANALWEIVRLFSGSIDPLIAWLMSVRKILARFLANRTSGGA